MPIRDTAAQNASLDNDYGSSHGPNAPASHEVALFIGDPMGDGYEVPTTTDVTDDAGTTTTVTNGYARLTWANDGTNWPAAADGIKTSATVTMPTSAAEYPDTVTHWALIASGGVVWDSAAFPEGEEIVVDAAGIAPAFEMSIFYNGLGA